MCYLFGTHSETRANQASGGKGSSSRTNVATFEFSFVFVTFVSRFFATKHSLIFTGKTHRYRGRR